MKTLVLSGRAVGHAEPTFVIAEAGLNHDGDPRVAEDLVRAASASGADAVKFQTYVTAKRVSRDSPIYDLLRRCELDHATQARLKELAAEEGIAFFSTPFDDESVDFLESIGTEFYKLASFDLVNLRLVRRLATTGKPVILSRGMANLDEIAGALDVLDRTRTPAALLHCVSAYPTPRGQANLRAIHVLREHFDLPVGYSDHTLGLEAPVAAVASGAAIVEKHFTLDRSRPGGDHALSVDPGQLQELVSRIRAMEELLGTGHIGCGEGERPTLAYRRST